MQLVGLTRRDRTLHPTSPSIKSGGEIIFDRSGKHKWQLRADPSFGLSVSDVDRLASRASQPPTDLVRRIAGSYHRPAPQGPAGACHRPAKGQPIGPVRGRPRRLTRPACSGHPTAYAAFSAAADDRHDDVTDRRQAIQQENTGSVSLEARSV